jgi:hypothetical protein
MLDEYAIEPEAMGASWSDFRYLVEKFGFDQGRLFPVFRTSGSTWFSMLPTRFLTLNESALQ